MDDTETAARRAAKATAPGYVLDRATAVPALVGRHEDLLFITGLGGTSRDVARITGDGPSGYLLGGAMGAACMMGLGLALARPDKRILVLTGDGEMLMSLGALATIAVVNPPNLAIICVDNGHYGETGYQRSHTGHGVDLERIAAGAGIRATRTIADASGLEDGSRFIRQGNGTSFVLLRVAPTEPPAYKRSLDASACRDRFRAALLGSR